MLDFNEYYVECEVAVLAKATGGLLSLDGDIVKLLYKRMLKMKDYGTFEPEGWEYEIDESPFYDLDEYKNYRTFEPEGWEYEIDESPFYDLDKYKNYKPIKMKRVEAYYGSTECSIPRDLKILEVYKTCIVRINTDVTKNL